MSGPGLVTLDLWLRIISTVSTFAIGLAACFLAYQQFRLSRSKLKFDLYEKRVALFNVVRDFASTYALRAKADSGKFYRDTVERYFLFEADVNAYIDEMYQKGVQADRTEQELQRPNLTEGERQVLNERRVEELTWFFAQSDNMVKVFSKDLSIKTLR